MKRYEKSQALWQKAESLVLCGVGTMSKSPRHIAPGACPVFVERASGAHFWDVDGNRYIDFPLALGAVVLGHAHPEVNEAVARQLGLGVCHSLSSPLELELAERLTRLIPCAEMVRLVKSGSEAASAAVRLARAFTGREVVLVCGYHGWHDWTAARMTRRAGVPESARALVEEFSYNDLPSLEAALLRHQGRVAAVMLEPVGFTPPQGGFLERAAELAHEHGALFVFDEIITGFRLALGGAQEYFGVVPDLAVFGKALANGLPLSLVAGRREIMEAVAENVFVSSTFAGETASLAAALATLAVLEREEGIKRLHSQGQILMDGLNEAAARHGVPARCQGLPHKTSLAFEQPTSLPDKALETLFRQECLRRGAFLGYGHFTCLAHTQSDLDEALATADQAFAVLRQGLDKGDTMNRLEGGLAENVFKRY